MATTIIQSFYGDVKIASNLTVDTNTLHVDSVAGRVGIGKTNPDYAADVNGTLNATGLYVGGSGLAPWSSNNSNIYYTTGAIGIGTDFPKKDLEVQGTIRLSNAATGGVSDLLMLGSSNRLSSSTPIEANGTLLSFTGQHICFPEGPMSQGLVVSANKNKYVSLNGPLTIGRCAIKSSESLPVVSLSNVVNDRCVFGVVDHFENSGTVRFQKNGIGIVRQEKESGDNRVIVNSLGEGAMWVANTNGPLESGDYITTSNIAGYGQKQDDFESKSYTVAKVTMDCDFEPEDVPVQVIKKDEDGQNILDQYGRIQWEDVPDQTEKEYNVRYLTTDGDITDQANAVWKAAYVGCTYHCG
jgi:hypothetical protein